MCYRAFFLLGLGTIMIYLACCL
ncbi:hypothetical protein CFP56_044024 [Quercus suber]|uniref:NADH dehydrogenase subunit 1 n=1 Tax=Quercus suber TaxID=58331 RepID=A0AAW0LH93_QUESU